MSDETPKNAEELFEKLIAKYDQMITRYNEVAEKVNGFDARLASLEIRFAEIQRGFEVHGATAADLMAAWRKLEARAEAEAQKKLAGKAKPEPPKPN